MVFNFLMNGSRDNERGDGRRRGDVRRTRRGDGRRKGKWEREGEETLRDNCTFFRFHDKGSTVKMQQRRTKALEPWDTPLN